MDEMQRVVDEYLAAERSHFTEQNLLDIKDYIQKMDAVLQISQKLLGQHAIYDSVNRDVLALLDDCMRLRFPVLKIAVESLFKRISVLLKSPYAGLTKIELDDIKNAMGMQQGHWYECPNGHPYVITECGGAMVQSKCHCGATIGGGSHRLRGDNRVATRMDGAREGAYDRMLRDNPIPDPRMFQ